LRRFLSLKGFVPQHLETIDGRKESRRRLWGSGKAVRPAAGPIIQAPNLELHASRSRILKDAGGTGFDSVGAAPDSPDAQSR
jgi:hypothetical protein